MNDTCPIMSIGKSERVDCTYFCAWFDTEMQECAISRINGNLKNLENMINAIDGICTSISRVDDTATQGLKMLINNL